MTPGQFALFARIEQDHWWFVARRQIVRQVIERFVPPSQGRIIIDVGCGTGGTIASLASDYRTVGVDTNADAIRFARQRFSNTTFIQDEFPRGLGDWLPIASALLCMDVIEHIEDDRAFVARMVQAMPVGAHVLLTVPADMTLWAQHDVTNDHFRRYDRATLMKVWAGLRVTTRLVEYFNSRLYPIVKAVRMLARMRRASYGADGTDFKMPARWANRALRRIFRGEGNTLMKSWDRPDRQAYRRGVSLIAVLRKDG